MFLKNQAETLFYLNFATISEALYCSKILIKKSMLLKIFVNPKNTAHNHMQAKPAANPYQDQHPATISEASNYNT